jgi:hypothetical protein
MSKVLEKLTVAQPVKKSPAFYGTERFITVLQNPPLVPMLSQLHPVHTFPPYFSKIIFNINLSFTHRPIPFRFYD